LFRWNVIRIAVAVGAFAAFAISSGAGWYWN
jgi:hypothetical protein